MCGQLRRGLGHDFPVRRKRISVGLRHQARLRSLSQRDLIGRDEGRVVCRQLVHKAAKRPHVTLVIVRPVFAQLGREVQRCADAGASVGRLSTNAFVREEERDRKQREKEREKRKTWSGRRLCTTSAGTHLGTEDAAQPEVTNLNVTLRTCSNAAAALTARRAKTPQRQGRRFGASYRGAEFAGRADSSGPTQHLQQANSAFRHTST